MTTPAAIELDAVSKVYGGRSDVPVVDTVSLTIPAGSFVSLLGPSGSGKSTILQMIGGFTAPTSGRILFSGEDVTGLPPERRPCNTIFQDLGLFPHMTVAGNVGYGLTLRGEPAARRATKVEAMLGLVDLAGFSGRRIHQLSGGQRQRVALARALVLEPSVLLLDEPLTGLDERLRQQLRDEIGRLHRRLGATFLAVTHNQDEALALSDVVAVLRAGRIEQIGSPRELFERPANAFVARFVGADATIKPQAVEPGAESWTAIVGDRRIACTPPPRRADAGGYVVALRPERIRAAGPGETGDLGPVDVVAATYKGRDVEVETRLGDGQTLKFLVPVHGGAAPPSPGARIDLAWTPDRALLVAETRAAEA
ncbi:ABC transporter ATP-binding protein [Methylobrevis albus]|uniref:ABC transporter ATP-binding protein n=1 Tax=Methylobrevis albus TaxID=2793297 RepID=A0A931I1X1_9HYPH|nr:ABC transporter ATP-binding protein [Methylobrevis albus]MBH0238757.1 ABC transporter ATP-binding protein [Methylobrevis albus]